MSDKTIKISPPEGYEIDKNKSTFEEIVFKKKESSLPMKWEELKRVSGYYIGAISTSVTIHEGPTIEENKNLFPSKEEAEAMLAMAQLCQLRDAWNKGWKPNWISEEPKWSIHCESEKIIIDLYRHYNRSMTFATKELAEKFLDTFRDLLEVAKPFL